ncbi:hypothetical protein DV735_g1730, partial [Chaetothyriales sp. CBS 134920]
MPLAEGRKTLVNPDPYKGKTYKEFLDFMYKCEINFKRDRRQFDTEETTIDTSQRQRHNRTQKHIARTGRAGWLGIIYNAKDGDAGPFGENPADPRPAARRDVMPDGTPTLRSRKPYSMTGKCAERGNTDADGKDERREF